MAVLKDLIVHGNSRFLNAAYFNQIKANDLAAEQGYFNKLIAVDGKISNLNVDDLTAQNATVIGLLDVKGELHTNSWTNANIATIDGSFYITPTVSCESGVFAYDGTNITVTAASGHSFGVDSLYTYTTSGTVTTYSSWPQYSQVLLTGEVKLNGSNEWQPLGTIRGKIVNSSTSSIKINSLYDSQGTTPIATLIDLGSTSITNANFRKVKVSLYERASNSSSFFPIGIYMTALGAKGKTFIDIYGGGDAKGSIVTNNIDSGAMAKPVLRIGNLSGLPVLTLPNGTSVAPQGWGIYTNNGFFQGTIVSTQGKIGNFTLNTAIYGASNGTGPSTVNATSTAGTYLGTDGFLNTASSTTYAQITNGVLTAQGAIIKGALTATSLATGTKTGSTSGNGIFIDSSGNIYAGNGSTNKFTVTSAGVLTATDAHISGVITVAEGSNVYTTDDVNPLKIGGKNLLRGSAFIGTGSGTAGGSWNNSLFYKSSSGGTLTPYTSITNSPEKDVCTCMKITIETANTQIGFAQSAVPVPKGDVTLSVWVQGTSGDIVRLQPIYDDSAETPETTGLFKEFTIPDSNWHRYSHTYNVQYDRPNGCRAGYVYVKSATVGREFFVCAPMLEVGNKVSDWTPAPQDYGSGINLVPWPYHRDIITTEANKPWVNNGITWTVNADGSITATGTSTNSYYHCSENRNLNNANGTYCLPAGTYTVSGCPKVNDRNTCSIQISLYPDTGNTATTDVSGRSSVYDYGDGVIFTIAEPTYARIHCRVYNGITTPSGGYTFRPMIEQGAIKHAFSSPRAIEGASQTATKYITRISDAGIRIHPASTENNSAVINADGMEIFKGGTAPANSVAFYGDTIRIGKYATGKRNVYVTDSAIQFRNYETVLAEYGDSITLYQPGASTPTPVVSITSTGATFTGGIVATSLVINPNFTLTDENGIISNSAATSSILKTVRQGYLSQDNFQNYTDSMSDTIDDLSHAQDMTAGDLESLASDTSEALVNITNTLAPYTESVIIKNTAIRLVSGSSSLVLDSGLIGFQGTAQEVITTEYAAYITADKLYINNAQLINNLVIGNFKFYPRDGRLTLGKI